MMQCRGAGGRGTCLGAEPGLRRRQVAPDVGLVQIPQRQLEEPVALRLNT